MTIDAEVWLIDFPNRVARARRSLREDFNVQPFFSFELTSSDVLGHGFQGQSRSQSDGNQSRNSVLGEPCCVIGGPP